MYDIKNWRRQRMNELICVYQYVWLHLKIVCLFCISAICNFFDACDHALGYKLRLAIFNDTSKYF